MEPNTKMEQQEVPLDRKHKVGIVVFKFEELNGMIWIDLSGRFPVTSARGNAYIIVLYCYTNNITAINSWYSDDIVKGYKIFYKELTSSGIIPVLQHIYNKINKKLIELVW